MGAGSDVDKTQSDGPERIDDLERLYERYAPRVFSVAARIVGELHAAEDITQEVFLKVHGNLDSFRGQSNPFTWIYRITVNLSINWAKQKRVVLTGDKVNATVASRDPSEEAVRKEERERVAVLLDTLPPDDRACLVLKDIEGLTYEQIAEILEIPVGTATTRVTRARAKFVTALQQRNR